MWSTIIAQSQRYSRTLGPSVLGIVGLALGLQWVGGDAYRQSLWILACTYALVALGMYVPFLMAGTLSLAYSAYAAIGGYAVAILAKDHGLPLWAGWLIALPVAAAVAIVLSLGTRRLSGFFLVAVTLLFANAFEAWARSSTSLTGGDGGIGALPQLDLFGWVPTPFGQAVLAAVIVGVAALALDQVRQSPWGVVVRTMREVPHAVEACGIKVRSLRTLSLALGAMIGSLAGGVFVSSVRIVTPNTFELPIVFLAVFMPIIGGMGTPWGAVLGAGIVAYLTLDVDSISDSGTLIVSIGVLIILLLAPRGVAGALDSLRGRLVRVWRLWREDGTA